MFVQVIQGQVADADELRAAIERWTQTLAPGATGWLGTTAGVTDDGTFVALVRFDSEEAARRNSARPEQHQWWMETAKLFSGDVTFHDSTRVVEFFGGGSDEAGFVQVIQGRSSDTQRMLEIMDEAAGPMREFRPEVIGGVAALYGDGAFTQAVYFTSEADAREAERKQAPPQLLALLEEESAILADLRYFDLRRPWLHSAR